LSNEIELNKLHGDELAQYISSLRAPEIQDSNEIEDEIVRRILAAQSPDEALGAGRLTQARDLIGVPLTIRGVRFNQSGFDTREGVYAVMDAVDHRTGEVLSVGCGARKVLAQLWVFQQRGWYPAELMITESANQTSNGYRVMQLERVAETSPTD
jgi:hypothetical protein